MTPVLPSNRELTSFCEERSLGGLRVVRFSDTIMIKIDVTPAEAATQLYIWTHMDPDIFCVPEPYRFFQDESQGLASPIGYLVMEYINGTCLSTYLESATSQDQEAVVDSILKALHHLAALPIPIGQGPGPVGGGPPRGYLWGDSGIVSSFASISEMDSWLNDILEYEPQPSRDTFDFKSVKLVMCHTDLAPRNILWLGDGQLALLDWGSAGFYPRVFEVYAFRTRVDREAIFAKILPRLTQQEDYEEQIQCLSKIEKILLRYGDSINLYVAYLLYRNNLLISNSNLIHRTPFKVGPGQG